MASSGLLSSAPEDRQGPFPVVAAASSSSFQSSLTASAMQAGSSNSSSVACAPGQGRLAGSRMSASADARRLQFMSAEADMSTENPNRDVYTSKTITEAAFAVLEELRRRGQLCDVTLTVGECEFRAHKVVLAATSPYFRGMFTGECV